MPDLLTVPEAMAVVRISPAKLYDPIRREKHPRDRRGRWNGTSWSIQPTPNPSSPGGGTLNWVACPSQRDCTAVGAAADRTGNPSATLAERWNGTRWSIQPTPNPAGVQGVRLEGVACTSPSACTAVGGSFGNASLADRPGSA
jgi:hypothetical protein